MDPQTERLARYLAHLPELGILDCRKPAVAAHQFTGIINEFFLWPWMLGREGGLAPDEDVIEDAVQIFLKRYRLPHWRRAPAAEYRRGSDRAPRSAAAEITRGSQVVFMPDLGRDGRE